MMEVFTGKRPTDEKFAGNLGLKEWVNESWPASISEVIDANLIHPEEEKFTMKMQWFSSILELALKCSSDSPEERIKIGDVLTLLKKIRYGLNRDLLNK